MRSPLVIPSPGKSTLPVLDSATVSLPTLTCSRAVVLATLRHLPDHVGRALVPAQSLEPGVAQLPGRGPLAEADLADQPRLDPVHPGLARAAPVERAAVLLQLGQLVGQPVQGLLVGPGPPPPPRGPAARHGRSRPAAAPRTRPGPLPGRCPRRSRTPGCSRT